MQEATDSYNEEYGYTESFIHEQEEYAAEAPYRHSSAQYIAREALQSYVEELNASCGVEHCSCGRDEFDYDFDRHGNPYWVDPFMEFCSCYDTILPKDSPLREKLKLLQTNYENSKANLNRDFSSTYEELDALTVKHQAYLAELELGEIE